MRAGLLAVSLAALLPSAAHAEPVTYRGTLGKASVVVEFTRDPATGLDGIAGRYFYRRVGGDIPLRAGAGGALAEEEPCDPLQCPEAGLGPDGAGWDLETADGGKTLSGSWKGAKSLPIQLERVGVRQAGDPQPATPQDLFSHSTSLVFGDAAITVQAEPYDALRLDVEFREVPGGNGLGGSFVYAVDPRTKFAMPRVAALTDGRDPAPANAALRARQNAFSLDAFVCLGGQYASFAEPGTQRFEGGGTLSGYDTDFTTEVTALAGHALSWTESGSLFCGGAHPNNFITSQTMDLRTGRLLQTADILRDFVEGTPSDALLAFLRERRPKPETDEDKDAEAACGTDELLAQGLAARFGEENGAPTLVFALEGLPHAIGACEGDLFALPISEARAWLSPQALALVEGR
ncbi:MAG: hypothetical protein DI629_05740 [Mesorhizobium amorphae]|nr:MAG: hypothetical protein DI629_05740 [Mesorhizobium amorphae]